jgi:hypothetical protein
MDGGFPVCGWVFYPISILYGGNRSEGYKYASPSHK